MTIYAEFQQLSQTSPFVELYKLDCSMLHPFGGGAAGGVYYFTPNIYPTGTFISFGGITYTPMPIQMTNFDVVANAAGQNATQPTPTVSISNVGRAILSPVVNYNNLKGAIFTRTRTLMKFLDGQPTADSTQYIGPDSYIVSQKTMHDGQTLSFLLASFIDQPNKFLPVRQVLKDPTTLNPTGFPGVRAYQ